MLVLKRKLGESIVINENITVKICCVSGKTVHLAVDAPREVTVHRAEVASRKEEVAE